MTCTGDINTSEMMERVLEAERPDLVVFTGDNVNGMTSNDAYSVCNMGVRHCVIYNFLFPN
jgi:predicted MPP superfamily phosphohydrolase